jgi:hypothetical protein
MEAMRERWTDDRLDDLNGKVDTLRLEMKTEFAAVRGEMDKRFDRVDARFDRIDARFEAMQRLMLQSSVAIIVALLGLIATQL